jgi:hypothetical protein
MPASDSSHTASSDTRKADGALAVPGQALPQDDLVELARAWKAAPPPRQTSRFTLGRSLFTLCIVALAALVCALSARALDYALEPHTPTDLGDLRGRWTSGERTLTADDNMHVSLRGLVPTRIQVVRDASDAQRPPAYLYFCPLYRILVISPRPPATVATAPDLQSLVQAGLATPEELTLEASAAGRLVRAADAPGPLAPFVESYARRLNLPVDALWVLEDGFAPSDAQWALWAGGMSLLAALLSIALFLRAPSPRRSP